MNRVGAIEADVEEDQLDRPARVLSIPTASPAARVMPSRPAASEQATRFADA